MVLRVLRRGSLGWNSTLYTVWLCLNIWRALTKRPLRLGCVVTFWLTVVGAEMEPATTRKMAKVYLHDNEIAVMIVWVFVGATFKAPVALETP